MPKIQASTVTEHRAKQRSALLDAARDSFVEKGYAETTFSEIASRSGLARSSVYEYFSSKDEILSAVCQAELPRWLEAIRKAMTRAKTPREKVAAWIRVQLRMVASGDQRLGAAMVASEVSPSMRASIAEVHSALTPPLIESLAALGWKHENLTASLVQGIVDAGTTRIEAGESSSVVIRSAVNLVLDGLG